jgi:DNA-binding HxlR family transcriptional regulator
MGTPEDQQALVGQAEEPLAAGQAQHGACRAREVFERVGDKWSVSVIHQLGAGTRRFTDLRQGIDGISQRMLTVTLRGLERDGIVTRTVHAVIPPRVDYALTPMGRTLLQTVGDLVSWADAHLHDIDAAREVYDRRMLDAAMSAAEEACTEAIASEERVDHVGH